MDARLLILSSPDIYASNEVSNAIPGVTAFGYDHDIENERRGKGQFGASKPVGITDTYAGIKGSFDVEGVNGERAVLAAIARVDRSVFVNVNANALKTFWIVANEYKRDGLPVQGYFVGPCKLDTTPKGIGKQIRFSFQAVEGQDFIGKEVCVTKAAGGQQGDVCLTGAYNPVTDDVVLYIPFLDGTGAYDVGVQKYALLVLRSNGSEVRELVAGPENAPGYYLEEDTGILLNSFDAPTSESEKVLVIFVRS